MNLERISELVKESHAIEADRAELERARSEISGRLNEALAPARPALDALEQDAERLSERAEALRTRQLRVRRELSAALGMPGAPPAGQEG